MRISSYVIVLVSLAGCTRLNGKLPLPESACSKLTTRSACEADPGCAVESCCGGFTSCYTSGSSPPACAGDCSPPECSTHTDDASCNADPGCAAVDCCGAFAECVEKGAPGQACPAACAGNCSSYTDEATCDAAPGCYSTFWPTSCTNAGCGYAFTACTAGAPLCATTQTCTNTLQSPNCVAPYAPDYSSDGCIVACVLSTACQ